MFPGMGGFDPTLAKVAADCGVPTVTIRYPHWTVLSDDAGYDFDALVRSATDQIAARLPAGAILLAGYSFGGIVAGAVAARLRDAGIPVRFLGLLDSEIQPDIDNRRGATQRRRGIRRQEFLGFLSAMRQGDGIGRIAYFVSRAIKEPRWRPVLDLYGRLPRRLLPRNFSRLLDRDLLFWHFIPLLRQWERIFDDLAPLPVQTFLFRTSQHDASAPDHLGWGRLCPDLTIVAMPGTHHELIVRTLPAMRAAFTQAVSEVLEPSEDATVYQEAN